MVNDDSRVPLPYFLNNPSKSTIRIEPDLHFCGPEMSEGANHPNATTEAIIRYGTPASDIFSLGLLAYEIYRYNLQIAPQGRTYVSLLQVHNNSLLEHANTLIPLLEKLDYSPTPYGLRQALIGMLQPNPIARITGLDIVNNPFFHSGDLTVFKTIDDLPLKDIGSQASALSSLPGQVSHFNARILENTVLPVICSLGVANPTMWTYSLPVIGFISTKLTTAAFVRVATPSIIAGLAIADVTDTLLAFVKHVDLLLEKFDGNFFSTYVIPMLCNGIDKQGATSLQATTIGILIDDRVLQAIDQQKFIGDLIPRVCREACKNNDSDVKLRGLYLLKTTANRFDKIFIIKSIFPSLKHIIEKSPGPVVITACVGVYSAMINLQIIPIDSIATDVLPVLLPILVDRTITRDQFEMILNRILHFQQQILTVRSTEMGTPEVVIAKNDNPGKEFFFFKEDSDKAKGVAISFGLQNSMLTPSTLPSSPPPQVPLSPPPIPFVPPPSLPSTLPPTLPSAPPPVPMAPPPPVPPIPMAPPPALPTISPPLAPPSAPPSFSSSASPPISAPPTVPPASSGSLSSIASYFSSPPAAPQDQYIPPAIPSAAPPMIPPAAPPMAPPAPQQDIDMDDFMASFSKPTPPPFSSAVPAASAPPKRASYSDRGSVPKKTGIPPPKPAQSSSARPAVNGMDDLFGNLTISQSPSPNLSASGTPPSLEEQFRKNQEEIQRLQQMQQPQSYSPQPAPSFGNFPMVGSGGNGISMQAPNSGGGGMMYGSQPSMGGGMNYGGSTTNASYGGQGQFGSQFPAQTQAPSSFGGMYGAPQQAQQGFYGQQQPANFSSGGGGGYGSQPQYGNQGGYNSPGYSNAPYGGAPAPVAPANGGYRPPQIPPPNQGSKPKSDPFDFLS